MPSDAMTGLRGLDDMLNEAGESVLVFGASGGIGHMAVQLAKRMGARVFAVASGDDGVALAKRLGAEAVVDGHKDDVVGRRTQVRPRRPRRRPDHRGRRGGRTGVEGVRDGGRVAYPNGVEPEPKARPTREVRAYDGDARPAGHRETQPPDRVRAVRGPRGPHVPARAGGRGRTWRWTSTPGQARPATPMTRSVQ